MQPDQIIGNAKIFDNFLDEQLHQDVWQMMNSLEYRRTDSQNWLKVWTLADGAILRSIGWDAIAPDWKLKPSQAGGIVAPPALVKLLDVVRKTFVHNLSDKKINKVNLTPCVWPPQTSISWHRDGGGISGGRTGAFTYYVHKEWNAEWGGELMLSDLDEELGSVPFDNSVVSNKLLESGSGSWIAPKPNRLVMNPSNAFHKVAKTTQAASPRLTIQGFLMSQ